MDGTIKNSDFSIPKMESNQQIWISGLYCILIRRGWLSKVHSTWLGFICPYLSPVDLAARWDGTKLLDLLYHVLSRCIASADPTALSFGWAWTVTCQDAGRDAAPRQPKVCLSLCKAARDPRWGSPRWAKASQHLHVLQPNSHRCRWKPNTSGHLSTREAFWLLTAWAASS
jgi:hypothetical protein